MTIKLPMWEGRRWAGQQRQQWWLVPPSAETVKQHHSPWLLHPIISQSDSSHPSRPWSYTSVIGQLGEGLCCWRGGLKASREEEGGGGGSLQPLPSSFFYVSYWHCVTLAGQETAVPKRSLVMLQHFFILHLPTPGPPHTHPPPSSPRLLVPWELSFSYGPLLTFRQSLLLTGQELEDSLQQINKWTFWDFSWSSTSMCGLTCFSWLSGFLSAGDSDRWVMGGCCWSSLFTASLLIGSAGFAGG